MEGCDPTDLQILPPGAALWMMARLVTFRPPMTYDPEKHHRRSIRLKGYDYSRAGAYFVTVCTQDGVRLFGEIVNGVVRLNEFGRIVKDEWRQTDQARAYVELDVDVVMPDHFHGIAHGDSGWLKCGIRFPVPHRFTESSG